MKLRLKKKFIIAMLLFAATIPVPAESQAFFKDVALDHVRRKAIEYVAKKGIFAGYDDNTFRPDRPVNRAELMKVVTLSAPRVNITQINRLFKEKVLKPQNPYAIFEDIPVAAWFAPYVTFGVQQSWAQGYGDDTFKPERLVNVAEALKIITESKKGLIKHEYFDFLKEKYDEMYGNPWYSKYVVNADIRKILMIDRSSDENIMAFQYGDAIKLDQPLTRGNLAELLYRFGTLTDKTDETEKEKTCFIPPLNEWKTYYDTKNNYAILYPPGWEAEEELDIDENADSFHGFSSYEEKVENVTRFSDGLSSEFFVRKVRTYETPEEYIENRQCAANYEIKDIENAVLKAKYLKDKDQSFGIEATLFKTKDENVYLIARNTWDICSDWFQNFSLSFTTW